MSKRQPCRGEFIRRKDLSNAKHFSTTGFYNPWFPRSGVGTAWQTLQRLLSTAGAVQNSIPTPEHGNDIFPVLAAALARQGLQLHTF